MKYKELIQFEPITTVIKLVASNSDSEHLIKSYVFSKKIKEDLELVVLRNLDVNPSSETRGIQIVGSYGTGKSHLMSVVASIAEDENLINFVSNEDLRNQFKKISGKYKVLKMETGTDRPLKDILFSQIERFLGLQGLKFKFDPHSNFSWKDSIQQMMGEFEEAFPNHHFLIVIDELLEYLKGREANLLFNDLMLLRQLGELCDHSRFKLMFGVQELLYSSPEFQFQSEMLGKVSDRYSNLIITKEDVSYVVQERLLKKDIHQKQKVREHLLKFSHLFDGINTNPNEYIDLFPVHPKFILNFEKIRHGKHQREILKSLSFRFEQLMNQDIPEDQPGLITYDQYWDDISNSPDLASEPDIRKVKETFTIIKDKINSHFVAGRKSKQELAIRIAKALSIRILCDTLDKKNGSDAYNLKEDLCCSFPLADNSELLLDIINNTAKQLVAATSGQYIETEPLSSQFYLRTEGGVNFEQLVQDYAENVLQKDPSRSDQYFFDILQYIMELQQDTYRTGFKIWEHSLEWIEKKSFRLGYIFFGNPNERSTTEPIQQYYIFFSPLFCEMEKNNHSDEVYFDLSKLSKEFKATVIRYGSSKALEGNATSDTKKIFQKFIQDHLSKAIQLFNSEFADVTQVVYQGVSKPLKSFSLPGAGASKDMIFKSVASRLLNTYFSDKYPYYPAFTDLNQPLTKENFDGHIQDALKKLVNPKGSNRNGEAILSGLGLWSGQSIEIQNSRYANSIVDKLKDRPPGAVLNKSEILYLHEKSNNLWYSTDFQIDYQLEFLVLSALVYKGDLEISWGGSRVLNASSIETITKLPPVDFYTFLHIKEHRDIPYKSIKALFSCLELPDLTTELEKQDTIIKIISEAKAKVEKVVQTRASISEGVRCRTISLVSEAELSQMKTGLEELSSLLDSIQSYNSYGKLKSFKYSEDELKKAFEAYSYCDTIHKLIKKSEKFEKLVGYLYTAHSYVSEDEKPLYDDIKLAIEKLGNVLSLNNPSEEKKYESLLNSLVDQYAEYYQTQYTKFRLNQPDSLIKERLITSDKKRICDTIKESDFVNKSEYEHWISSITSLSPASPGVTKEKIKQEPFHSFNPREYHGKPYYAIRILEEQLDSIYDKWVLAMKSIFKDPGIQENLSLLSSEERSLIEKFRLGEMELNLQNASKLRDLISQISRGIDKVEISMEILRSVLNRPLTPQETIDALTQKIEELCAGRERNKVRIVFV